MKLASYFRSTAAYRVRIALNLKQIDHSLVPIHLLRNGGEHKQPNYQSQNPEGLVPALFIEDRVLSQSLAILEYLDETHPTPPLLPGDPLDRAYVRGLALSICCDIHPLNNLRVLQYLSGDLNASDEQKNAWYQHWIATGFSALETRLANHDSTGEFCFGDTPSMADLCLVPQVYNANRFNCPLDDYPIIQRINARCLQEPSFTLAAPENQVDAE
ncbi:maleylacetoacetate isomerase [Arenicella chitinivorans]|uniref:Maleylacetoacetate isomerase n=1 Tax=Arenicella chitinivorans TaxID=1329800 RepID=A0A918RWI1_9GAMM|nr:maleylacetoacetate isomerase [Arenicella chitinivorans]GHA13751.1 maleylacetoacetate isomerase [Arenicella chitinivorans]